MIKNLVKLSLILISCLGALLVRSNNELPTNVSVALPACLWQCGEHVISVMPTSLNADSSTQVLRFAKDTIHTTSSPVAPTVFINGDVASAANPLLNTTACLMVCSNPAHPIIVTAQEPSTIYCMFAQADITKATALRKLTPFCMPDGSAVERIKNLSVGTTDALAGTAAVEHIFSVVQGVDGALALGCYAYHSTTKTYTQYEYENEDKLKSTEVTTSIAQWELLSSAPVSNHAYALPIASELNHKDCHVVSHWDQSLERLFIALSWNDTAKSAAFHTLLVAYVSNKQVHIHNFYPTPEVQPGYVTHLKTLWTASKHSALVMGMMHTQENKNPHVVCLPLVYSCALQPQSLSPDEVIAHKNSIATLAQQQGDIQHCASKGWRNKTQQMELCHHAAALSLEAPNKSSEYVGAPKDLPGPISSLRCSGDAIVVSVAEAQAGHQPGIFSCQALYDAQGHIQAWTAWRRVLGVTDPVNDFVLENNTGIVWYLTPNPTGLLFKHSSWKQYLFKDENISKPVIIDDNAHVLQKIATLFAQQPLGIIGTASTEDLLVCVGAKSLVYAYKNNENTLCIAQISPTLFESLGSLSCAACSSSNDQKIILAGGTHGLLKIPLADNGNPAHATASPLLALKFVTKIIAYRTSLCVVADGKLYWVDENNNVTDLDKAAQLGTIFDIALLADMLLVGTAQGLSYANVAENNLSPVWHALALPQAQGPVTRFSVTNNHDSRYAKIYVLSQSIENAQSVLHALTLSVDSTTGRSTLNFTKEYAEAGGTITKGKPCLCSNAQYDMFVTDGLLSWTAGSQQTKGNPGLLLLPLQNRRLSWNKTVFCHSLATLDKKAAVADILYSDVLETWLVVGNFGIIHAQ